MARQNINVGSSANDGTGDTLRTAGSKMNSNFIELYNFLGAEGDSSSLASRVTFQDSAVVFEGLSVDAHETRLFAADPTADRDVTIPNASGVVVLNTATQTLTNKTVNLSANTLTGTTAQFNTALSDGSFATLAGAETLANKTLTTPKIANAGFIADGNGNEQIIFNTTASAVNELTITNKAANGSDPAAAGPTIAATGGDTNVNIGLSSKGSGSVSLSKAAFGSATLGTTPSAAPATASLIIGNLNSGGPLAVSLAAGTTVGEFKIFTNKGSEVMTVTPTGAFAHGTSFSLVQNRSTECIWDGSNWFLLGFGMRDSGAGGITIT